MKVLLIVDLQNDFCKGGALAVPEGEEIAHKVNSLMRTGAYDLVIASKDWHPENHGSFAANHPGKELYSKIELSGLEQTLWPVHCVQGSKGSEFHRDLDQSYIQKVIYKGTDPDVDSYSAFYDNGRRHETELRAFLEDKAKEYSIEPSEIELDVCGLALDYCVGFTARDAANLGYQTRLVLDATRAVNLSPGDDLKMLRELAELGVDIIEARDVLPRSVNFGPRAAALQP